LTPGFDLDKIFNNLKEKYKNHSINTEDGLKIDFESDWVHLRSSNTEPIIRIYAESNSQNVADNIAQKLMKDIQEAGVSNQ
jgi:phosphomannomutase